MNDYFGWLLRQFSQRKGCTRVSIYDADGERPNRQKLMWVGMN